MIVISDMMGTLTTGSPVLGIVDWVGHNQSKNQARWLIARMMPGYLLVKIGLLDSQPWGQKLMIQSLDWVRDVTPQKFQQVADWAVEHNLWPKRRTDVISMLSRHAQNGAQVYIASSVVEPITESFAHRFGAQAIGTPILINNGRASLATDLIASDRKIQEVLTRLNLTCIDYAYGDTAMDIPLLEHAEHPIAFYPDKQLQDYAKKRGWDIFGEN